MGTWWGGFACDDCWEPRTSLSTTGLPSSSAVETSGLNAKFLLKNAFSSIGPFPRLNTKHFKYLPGSDPRHPLQAGQICRAISQLQSSWLQWWERNHNSAGRKEKVVVLNPSHLFYIDNSCILAQSAVNRRTLSHGEDHHRNS